MRTPSDREAELAALFQARFFQRLRHDCDPAVVGAYERSPLGPHDDKTRRVVRGLGGASITGKAIILSLGTDGPWGVGNIVIGEPGNFVRCPGIFLTYEDALRHVFSLRCRALFATESRESDAQSHNG
ncbi:hypothetical protein J2W43_001807 [Pseudomonas brassicacearum]|uniref:N,N-dimethylformamidase alpha subunit domain-containing protein n=1 Tax=Pseudomonas brassicacearum TaxID=930166 RepID=A0AAW8M7A4_9PSED|nr:hypothetical protein [Pseudomonas brassicacearum]MDR6957826.1 hypothetical protein [Pseudomonas brassicacearum]